MKLPACIWNMGRLHLFPWRCWSTSQPNNTNTTNDDIGYNQGGKGNPWVWTGGLQYLLLKEKWLPLFLHWLTVRVCCGVRGVHRKCVPIHFLKVCWEKASLLWCSPHMGRLHLLFITSWLYFSSKFQDGVQSAKKETLPVCVREHYCYFSLWACRSSPLTLWHNSPDSVSPLQETFANIWEYIGLSFWQDRGQCVFVCLCCECVFPVALHKAHMNIQHLKV